MECREKWYSKILENPSKEIIGVSHSQRLLSFWVYILSWCILPEIAMSLPCWLSQFSCTKWCNLKLLCRCINQKNLKILGWCGRPNMLWPYQQIWDWDLISVVRDVNPLWSKVYGPNLFYISQNKIQLDLFKSNKVKEN